LEGRTGCPISLFTIKRIYITKSIDEIFQSKLLYNMWAYFAVIKFFNHIAFAYFRHPVEETGSVTVNKSTFIKIVNLQEKAKRTSLVC